MEKQDSGKCRQGSLQRCYQSDIWAWRLIGKTGICFCDLLASCNLATSYSVVFLVFSVVAEPADARHQD